jgi:hypothetical protein
MKKVHLSTVTLSAMLLAGCAEVQKQWERVDPAVRDSEVVRQAEPVVSKAGEVIREQTRKITRAIEPSAGGSGPEFSQQEMAAAIKQALEQGVNDSIYLLGYLEGFNLSNRYRIPLPPQLDKPAALLRKLGQGDQVDEFEERMNRAAKLAVKQAAPVFTRAIEKMTVRDAIDILQGSEDSATRYFRRVTEADLRRRFLPIIENATDQTGLTRSYKSLTRSLNRLAPQLSGYTVDIDRYVLDNALNALFDRIAVEERLIRQQPAKRSTELMKRVFGYFGG